MSGSLRRAMDHGAILEQLIEHNPLCQAGGGGRLSQRRESGRRAGHKAAAARPVQGTAAARNHRRIRQIGRHPWRLAASRRVNSIPVNAVYRSTRGMGRKPKKPPAMDAEEARLWADYRSAPDDPARRNALIERYLPLVRDTARRLRWRLVSGLEVEDLVDDGVFGLVQAIEMFDPGRGLRFASFAFWRIRGAMIDGLRELDPLRRLARAQISRLEEARRVVACRGPATAAELAAELGISESQLASLEAEAKRAKHVSIDLIRQHRDGDQIHEISRDEADEREPPPSARTQRSDLFRLVLRGCNRSERLILILYYYEDLTFREIGHTLGVTESRVSQLHAQLVDRLRLKLDGRQSEFTDSEPGAR